MGHNIGLNHDCINYDCRHWKQEYLGPRTIGGVKCYGYMDYRENTHGWSPCSVADLLTYINKLEDEFCLTTISKLSSFPL